MNEFKFICPRNGMCVIQPYEAADRSATGLIVANNNNTAGGKVRGVIVEMATDCDQSLKVGMTVLFRRYSSDELKYIGPKGEETVILVHQDEILATPILA